MPAPVNIIKPKRWEMYAFQMQAAGVRVLTIILHSPW